LRIAPPGYRAGEKIISIIASLLQQA